MCAVSMLKFDCNFKRLNPHYVGIKTTQMRKHKIYSNCALTRCMVGCANNSMVYFAGALAARTANHGSCDACHCDTMKFSINKKYTRIFERAARKICVYIFYATSKKHIRVYIAFQLANVGWCRISFQLFVNGSLLLGLHDKVLIDHFVLNCIFAYLCYSCRRSVRMPFAWTWFQFSVEQL